MFKNINSMTGNVIAEYPQMTTEAVRDILEEAYQTQQEWQTIMPGNQQ